MNLSGHMHIWEFSLFTRNWVFSVMQKYVTILPKRQQLLLFSWCFGSLTTFAEPSQYCVNPWQCIAKKDIPFSWYNWVTDVVCLLCQERKKRWDFNRAFWKGKKRECFGFAVLHSTHPKFHHGKTSQCERQRVKQLQTPPLPNNKSVIEKRRGPR